MAIVLESPHVSEYEGKPSPLKNPTTSTLFSKHLPSMLFKYITMVSNQYGAFSRAVRDIENNIYRIKLINAVQYQCSLGELSDEKDEKRKNRIVNECLQKQDFQDDLVNRLKGAEVIINCCTGQENGKVAGAQKRVQDLIDEHYPRATRLYGYHPSSSYFLSGFKKVQ